MQAWDIFVQVLGIFGMISIFISYQCKNTKTLFVWQMLCAVFFSFNFYFLGAITGAVLNFINIFRSIAFMKVTSKKGRTISCAVLCIAYLTAGIFTYQSWLSLLVIISSVSGTICQSTGNGKAIRYGQFFCISPLWLIHNIFEFSIGGILAEIFNMVSVVVFVCRVGVKNFFTKPYSEIEKLER